VKGREWRLKRQEWLRLKDEKERNGGWEMMAKERWLGGWKMMNDRMKRDEWED